MKYLKLTDVLAKAATYLFVMWLLFGCQENTSTTYCNYNKVPIGTTNAQDIGKFKYVYAGCSDTQGKNSMVSVDCNCPSQGSF